MNQPPPYGQPQGYGPTPGYGPPPGAFGPPQFPPPKKGMGVGTILLIIGGICLLLFGGCVGLIAFAGKSAADKQAKEKQEFEDQKAMEVSAETLIADYGKNEIAGDQKYKGKKLKVTGEIKSIASGINDEPTIHLGKVGELEFETVMVEDLDKSTAAKLEKGKTITVICKGNGEFIGSPVLKDCKID
jgi:hypothetical protein